MFGLQRESKRYPHGHHLTPQDADLERIRIRRHRSPLDYEEWRHHFSQRGYHSDVDTRRRHRYDGDRERYRASSLHRAQEIDRLRQDSTSDSEDEPRERSYRRIYGEHHFDDPVLSEPSPPSDGKASHQSRRSDEEAQEESRSRPHKYGDHYDRYLVQASSRINESRSAPLQYGDHRLNLGSPAGAPSTIPEATTELNYIDIHSGKRYDDPGQFYIPLPPDMRFFTSLYHKDYPHTPQSTPNIITPHDSRSEALDNMPRPRTGSGASITSSGAPSPSPSLASSSLLGPRVYQYQPLQESEIRLVRVLPKRMWKLKCEIMHVSLNDSPVYSAISYAWGDGVDTKPLVLEGVTIPVAASLHEALMAVRRKEKAILVWIDALCINQQDKDERATQVRLMGQIYSGATSIAIWIGPEYEESALAMQLLGKVAENTVEPEYIKSTRDADSLALFNLFKRGYWKRLWVVQEVLLGKNKTVYCGRSSFPWEVYQRAADVFWSKDSDPHIRQGPSSFPDRDTLKQLGDESLLEVLRACRKKLSENPRDKVFGILGLLSDDTQRDFPVDYSQSVKAVYIDVVDHSISTTDNLDVIREAIHFPLHVNSTGLPSWCPDWSHIPEVSGLGRTLNFAASRSANGSTKAQYWFHDERRKLEVCAIRIDTVMATGVAVGTFCAAQDYLTAFLQWRSVLLHELNVEDGNESHSIHKYFCRTLCLGQVPLEYQPEDWRDLCYHVFAALIRERMPRMPMDEDLKQYADITGLIEPRAQRKFLQDHFGNRMMGRSLCVTENGLIGMGSGYMTAKDVVVVPFGCSTPVLLRPAGHGNEYQYVGDVYIDGYMHGEAVDQMEAKDPRILVSKYVLC